MKAKFSSIDIVAMVAELQRLVGMRLIQAYDIDTKTYLLKLGRQEEKAVLLFESGIRIHTTEYDWPKNMSPSGFSMKLRKHLENKRLERIQQVGVDRIVDLQFGINEATYHIIIELYDRGNVVLTDGNFLILNILRPRQAGSEDVRFAVREVYPFSQADSVVSAPSKDDVGVWLSSAKKGDTLKKLIVPKVSFGPAVLDHCLRMNELTGNTKVSPDGSPPEFVDRVVKAIEDGNQLLEDFKKPDRERVGIITLKVDKRAVPTDTGSTEIISYDEFHPLLFKQHEPTRYESHPSFAQAVDIFFSSQEEQRIDLKAHNLEKEAVKKLENVKLDHQRRVQALELAQKSDSEKGALIECNLDLVEASLYVIRSLVASQMSWKEIELALDEAREEEDLVATRIQKLNLDKNEFSILLKDPYEDESPGALVEIDLDLTAYANARRFFDMKKQAASKQKKTIDSSTKALKSAQQKTREVLKQVELTTNIARSRKTYWFEKFFWFISSENYLVIAGRDAQQNELVVKKYLNKGDLYVHADIHGASSVVIKNPSGEAVPPKTLNEAGTMAICYSVAWEAKVITRAWWVHHDQVSKTAPTGEYLSQGSFMVRGKKNYLPPLYLIMGFGFMFRLDEESLARHKDDRKVRVTEEIGDDVAKLETEVKEAEEIKVSSSEDELDSAFPDTQVNVMQPIKGTGKEENEEVIVFSQAVRKKQTVTKVQAKKKKDKNGDKKKPEEKVEETPLSEPKVKKISKAKQRKIQKKYGDQDDEERQMRMNILASAGRQPTVKAEEKVEINPEVVEKRREEISLGQKLLERKAAPEPEMVAEEEAIEDEVEEDDEKQTGELMELINSLTGVPHEDDGLMYAVPVCAPYSTMTNYKFKVKLTPGTGKRGRASKTAMTIFQQDKSITQRERDLIRVSKDQDVARNMPGSVKMSAPNLQKAKR